MIDKEKIFNYMDGTYLVNAEEVLGMAQDAYAYAVYGDTDKQLSRGEFVESEEIAQEYIERKGMKFDEEGNIIESDSELIEDAKQTQSMQSILV